jgi:hypothetical protein
MDWYDPSKGTISVRVTKVAGTGGSARRGILMVDPGGPGSDGSTLATRTAKSEPDLLTAYDIIVFAPRTAASRRLRSAKRCLCRSMTGFTRYRLRSDQMFEPGPANRVDSRFRIGRVMKRSSPAIARNLHPR